MILAILADQRFGISPPGTAGIGSLFTDGDAHTRLRRLLARTFTARSINALRPEFPEPERFDPAREPNRHCSFGHGAHHCLGAQLARIELAEQLRALAEQLPGLRLGCAPEELVSAGNPLDDGPIALPVTW